MVGEVSMININEDPGRPINMLLKLYNNSREEEAETTQPTTREERRLYERLEYINHVSNELNLTKIHKLRIRHIVTNIEKLSNLCKKCKWETIITAIAFYVKCYYQQNCNIHHINRYSICKENKLTLSKYAVILTRLAGEFQTDEYLSPLCPTKKVRRTLKKSKF